LFRQEILCFLAVFLLILAKSSRVFIRFLSNSLIINSLVFMDREYAQYLLNKTKEDYNLIAEDWSKTRSFVIFEEKEWFLRYISAGDKVLDLGCGNGRFFEIFNEKKVDYTGVDFSEKLIEIAKSKYPKGNFLVSSVFNLPFPDNFFDRVLCVAVFHHIPSKELRLNLLKEIKRIMKPGGRLILTIWNLNPIGMILIGKYKRFLSFLKYFILKILGRSKLDFKDFYIPWRNILLRYIHFFTKTELKELVKQSGLELDEIGSFRNKKSKEGNIYIIAKKYS